MKCKKCGHEKIEHMQMWNEKLCPSKCDFINCKCKRFVAELESEGEKE